MPLIAERYVSIWQDWTRNWNDSLGSILSGWAPKQWPPEIGRFSEGI